MTLCIAAATRTGDGKPCIVLCADHMVGTWAAQAEIGFKYSWARNNWPALIAGDVSRTAELIAVCQSVLGAQELQESNVFDVMKSVGHAFKAKLADDLVRAKLSVSYEYLRQNRSKFPAATVYEIYTEISRIDSEAELIVAGFIKGHSYIFVFGRDCTVSLREHFAAIGTGAFVAEPSLFQRKQNAFVSLGNTLYNVYEAKRLGEIAEGVGKRTTLSMIMPSQKPGGALTSDLVLQKGKEFLEAKYTELSFKTSSDIELPDGSFKRYE